MRNRGVALLSFFLLLIAAPFLLNATWASNAASQQAAGKIANSSALQLSPALQSASVQQQRFTIAPSGQNVYPKNPPTLYIGGPSQKLCGAYSCSATANDKAYSGANTINTDGLYGYLDLHDGSDFWSYGESWVWSFDRKTPGTFYASWFAAANKDRCRGPFQQNVRWSAGIQSGARIIWTKWFPVGSPSNGNWLTKTGGASHGSYDHPITSQVSTDAHHPAFQYIRVSQSDTSGSYQAGYMACDDTVYVDAVWVVPDFGTGCANVCGPSPTACPAVIGASCDTTFDIGFPGSSGTYSCHLCENMQTVSTAPGGTLSPTVTDANPQRLSPAKSINQYNNRNALWLLTCPALPPGYPHVPPTVTNSKLIYVSPLLKNMYTNIAGDVCLADASPLSSTFDLPVTVSWNPAQWAQASVGTASLTPAASVSLSDISYSPQLNIEPGTNVISGSLSVNSYIFEHVPAASQNVIWNWDAKFADLSKVRTDTETLTGTFVYKSDAAATAPASSSAQAPRQGLGLTTQQGSGNAASLSFAVPALNAPTISANPTKVIPGQTSTITSSTVASGTPPYTFTWLASKDGAALTAAYAASLGCTAESNMPLGSSTNCVLVVPTTLSPPAGGTPYNFKLRVTDANKKTVTSAQVSVIVYSIVITPHPAKMDIGSTSAIISSNLPSSAQGYTFTWIAGQGASSLSSGFASAYCKFTSTATSSTCVFSPPTASTYYRFRLIAQDKATGKTYYSNIATVRVASQLSGVKVLFPGKVTTITIHTGQKTTAYVASITGGTSPYSYQWLVEAPGSSSLNTADAQKYCANPTSSKCTIAATTSTPGGTYLIELQLTDSGGSPPVLSNQLTLVINVYSCLYQANSPGADDGFGKCVLGCPGGAIKQGAACDNYKCSGSCTVCQICTTSTTTIPPPPPPTTDCNYIYKYTETTQLVSAQNLKIPFYEARPKNPQLKPLVWPISNPPPIMPYFTANYVMPSTQGQFLQNSYDTYSPWNYWLPKGVLEPLPLDLLSNLFFNFTSDSKYQLGWISPSNLWNLRRTENAYFTEDLILSNFANNGKQNQHDTLTQFGLAGQPNIDNPISISTTTTDYIFVLNETGGDYYLNVFRMVPKGYYNTSNRTPGTVNTVVQSSDGTISTCGSPVGTTTYRYQVTDSNSNNECSAGDAVVVHSQLALANIGAPSTSINTGQAAYLTAKASGGTPPYKYQWYAGSPNCNAAEIVPGAMAQTYITIPSSTTTYTYQATDSALSPVSECSNPITVTVTAPAVPVQLNAGVALPVKPALDSGQSVTLAAYPYGGTQPYNFQWFSDGSCTSPITGQNSATYAVVSPASTSTFSYNVVDSAATPGVVCSGAITVSVNPALAPGSITPANPTINGGDSVKLSVTPSGGTQPYSYQWYGDGTCTTPIPGAISSSYVAQPPATSSYSVLVTDSAITPVSTCAQEMVTVSAAASSLTAGQVTPQSPQIDEGQTLALNANPQGGSTPYKYKWYTGTNPSCSSDVQISGATAQQFTVQGTECSVVSGAKDPTALWNSNWKAYWANVINVQNNTVYLVSSAELGHNDGSWSASSGDSPIKTLLSTLKGAATTQTIPCGSGSTVKASNIDSFQPLNISTSANGDVYITGVVDAYDSESCGSHSKVPGVMELAFTPAGGGVQNYNLQPALVANTTAQWSFSFSPGEILNEIAASPDGQLIYLANQSAGNIYKLSGTSQSLDQNIVASLAFSSVTNEGEASSISTGTQQSALNIAYYLEEGGLYGVAFDSGGPKGGYWSLAPAQSDAPNNNNRNVQSDFDTEAFHHVIGMQDIDGYLYVLDEWKGRIGYATGSGLGLCWTFWSCSHTDGGTYFDILLLRALDSGLADTQINPTLFPDLYSTKNCVANYNPTGSGGVSYTAQTCVPSTATLPTLTCTTSTPGTNCPALGTSDFPIAGCCLSASTGCTGTDNNGNSYKGVRQFCVSVGATSTGGSSYLGLASSLPGTTDPPYGWTLSANITPTDSSDYPVTFCSSPYITGKGSNVQCTYNLGNTRSTCLNQVPKSQQEICNWLPVGPALNAQHGSLANTGFTMSENGTVAMLFKQSDECFGGFLGIDCTSAYDPIYNSLLVSQFNIANYTKLSVGDFKFSCYTDSQNDASSLPTQGCLYLNGPSTWTDYIANMNRPILYVSNPFRDTESLGATQVVPLSSATSGVGLAAGAQPCTGGGGQSGCNAVYKNDGPPLLTMSGTLPDANGKPTNNAGWGQQLIVTVSPKPKSSETYTDNFQLEISSSDTSNPLNANPIIVPPGGNGAPGAASYTVCSSPSSCLQPDGTAYSITGQDLGPASKDTVTDSLTIKDTPLISMPGTMSISASTDPTTGATIYSESPESVVVSVYSKDLNNCPDSNPCSVSVSVDGVVGAVDASTPPGCIVSDSSSGSISASQPQFNSCFGNGCSGNPPSTSLCAGTYTVTASSSAAGGGSSSATLQVQPPAGKPSLQGGAETLTSQISGYLVVPYSYTYEIKQSWTLLPFTGDKSCPVPTPPSTTDTTNTVFSYSLVNANSDQLTAQVEGGDSYLYDLYNNAYYHANLTDVGPQGVNLVLPPQIIYDVQNNRIFGNIRTNITTCPGSSGFLNCGANSQSVINATAQYYYTITSLAQKTANTYPGLESFSTKTPKGSIYGPTLSGSARIVRPLVAPTPPIARSTSTDATHNVILSVPSQIYIYGLKTTGGHAGLTVTNKAGNPVVVTLGGTPLTPAGGSPTPLSLSLYTDPRTCHKTSTCLLPGTYAVQATDAVTNINTPPITLIVLPTPLGYNYAATLSFVSVPIFELFKQVIYNSPLQLMLNASQYTAAGRSYPLRGYEQLVYVMNDRFNNNVYVPVEADIANPVSISLNINSQADVNDPNMSTITINGIAGSYSVVGTVFTPLPQKIGGKQQYIYVYYNQDLNFANNGLDSATAGGKYSAVLDPTDAQLCAYASQQTLQSLGITCVQSNPVYTGTSGASPPDPTRQPNSGVITYSPSYNALGPNNCQPPTQGLLSPEYFSCNIYDHSLGAALSNTCPTTGALNFCSQLNEFQDVAACLSHGWAEQSGAAGTLQDPQSFCSAEQYPSDPTEYQDFLTCAADPIAFCAKNPGQCVTGGASETPVTYTGGTPQWCEQTDAMSGNGICSSQVGLIPYNPPTPTSGSSCKPVKVAAGVAGIPICDSNGDFSTQITACGSRTDQITAVYYGWPPPEPVQAVQVPLSLTANVINSRCSRTPGCAGFATKDNAQLEYNYQYSPAQATGPVQIGSFELSYGSMGLLALLATIGSALLLLYRGRLMSRRSAGKRQRIHINREKGTI